LELHAGRINHGPLVRASTICIWTAGLIATETAGWPSNRGSQASRRKAKKVMELEVKTVYDAGNENIATGADVGIVGYEIVRARAGGEFCDGAGARRTCRSGCRWSKYLPARGALMHERGSKPLTIEHHSATKRRTSEKKQTKRYHEFTITETRIATS